MSRGTRKFIETTDCDSVYWTSDLVRGRVDELCAERC